MLYLKTRIYGSPPAALSFAVIALVSFAAF
jgi:hypothetical protein